MHFTEVVRDLGPLVTAVAVLIAVWTLRANHEWNRRNYTANLISEWNGKTAAHRRAIEKLRPSLVDLHKGKVSELTKQNCIDIYTSKVDSPEWELRFHFIELLNYFESIAVAYKSGVADKKMIEGSVRNPLVRWHAILLHFMETVEEQRGYKPWKPFNEVVALWNNTPVVFRRETA